MFLVLSRTLIENSEMELENVTAIEELFENS